jgi:hypothetical protein
MDPIAVHAVAQWGHFAMDMVTVTEMAPGGGRESVSVIQDTVGTSVPNVQRDILWILLMQADANHVTHPAQAIADLLDQRDVTYVVMAMSGMQTMDAWTLTSVWNKR